MGLRKISLEQEIEIMLHFVAGRSIKSIAEDYGVTRGAIQFIVHPDKAELNKQRAKLRQRKLRTQLKEKGLGGEK